MATASVMVSMAGQSLMIPLMMIVLHVLLDCSTQRLTNDSGMLKDRPKHFNFAAFHTQIRDKIFPCFHRFTDLSNDRFLSFPGEAKVLPDTSGEVQIAGIITLVDVQCKAPAP